MSETQPNRPQREEPQQFMNWDENMPTVTLSNNSANLQATSNETMRNDYEPPQSEFVEYNNNLYQSQQQANMFNQQQNWSQPHSEAEYYNRPLPTIHPEYYNQYYPQQDQQTIIVVPTTQMQDASYVSDDTMKVAEVADDQAANRFGKLSGLVCCKGLLRRSREAKDENKKKHQCCCCSRKVCLIIIAVILVILAGLAVLLYFLFPSPPAIEVGDPVLLPPGLKVNNQSVSTISGSILNQPEFALSMDLATQVTFNSTSFITFGIKNIEVTVSETN